MRSTDRDRFFRLVAWAKSQGGSLDPRVEIYRDETTKFSLRVREDDRTQESLARLRAGDRIASCTTSMTLSYLNAIIDSPLASTWWEEPASPAFPARFMEMNPSHVIGRFFLIQQYLKGEDSFWSTYIETLPQPEHLSSWSLPAFWPSEDAAWLAQTNAAGSVEEMQGIVSRDYKKARMLLKEASFPGWQGYTRLLYNWAFCIFTSRSFRPSLVLSAETMDRVAAMLPDGCKLDDFSLLLPVFDIPNHSPTARVTWDAAADPTSVHFRVEQEYKPGNQIFNNYGMKTNSELLLAYGFVLPETEALHNDYIHLRKRTQAEGSQAGAVDEKDIRDFVISLRPLSHPSSLIGRSRQFPVLEGFPSISPRFGHFEDALLWDLCFHLAVADEKAAMEVMASSEDQNTSDWNIRHHQSQLLSRVLRADPAPEFLELSKRVKETLVTKLTLDYDRLLEAGVEAEADAEEEDFSLNQSLALQYRKQCAKVLKNAIMALDSEAALSRQEA